jgi:hypothetical protein
MAENEIKDARGAARLNSDLATLRAENERLSAELGRSDR